jgi:aminoglycoside 6'-N-acetyltransferase
MAEGARGTEVAGTGGPLRLRTATRDDLALLRRWDEAPHVIASDPHDDWQWEAELGVERAGREQLIAEVDGRPIGYLEILDPARDPQRYWGADAVPGLRAIDIWIGEADALGQGHGTRVMRLALERCFEDPTVTAVLVDPLADNLRAQAFYQRLGFVPLGRRRFGQDLCEVHRLERDDWQKHEPAASVSDLVTRIERTP